jgi:cytochrome P450
MSQGFSDAATRSFEPKILTQVEKLCRILEQENEFVSRSKNGWGEPIDMSRYCLLPLFIVANLANQKTVEYLSFDIMSSIIFSANYNTLERSEYRHVSKAIEGSNIRMSVILQAPELKWQRLDKKLFPQSIRARNIFVKFVSGVLGGRMKQSQAQEKDIFSFFQNAVDAETGKGFGVDELAAETATLVVAGGF